MSFRFVSTPQNFVQKSPSNGNREFILVVIFFLLYFVCLGSMGQLDGSGYVGFRDIVGERYNNSFVIGIVE